MNVACDHAGGSGEVVQWLRALPALPEDWSMSPSESGSQPPVTPVPWRTNASTSMDTTLVYMHVHTHVCTHTLNCSKNKFLEKCTNFLTIYISDNALWVCAVAI